MKYDNSSCRDCYYIFDADTKKCPYCGGTDIEIEKYDENDEIE